MSFHLYSTLNKLDSCMALHELCVWNINVIYIFRFDSGRDSGNLTSTTKLIDENHIEVDRDQDGNVPLFFYTFANKPPALSKGEKNSALGSISNF